MAGNSIGGKKAAAKNLANDPDFYKKIGRRGGKALVPKGFARMDEATRAAAGSKGGKVSKRRRSNVNEDKS